MGRYLLVSNSKRSPCLNRSVGMSGIHWTSRPSFWSEMSRFKTTIDYQLHVHVSTFNFPGTKVFQMQTLSLSGIKENILESLYLKSL